MSWFCLFESVVYEESVFDFLKKFAAMSREYSYTQSLILTYFCSPPPPTLVFSFSFPKWNLDTDHVNMSCSNSKRIYAEKTWRFQTSNQRYDCQAIVRYYALGFSPLATDESQENTDQSSSPSTTDSANEPHIHSHSQLFLTTIETILYCGFFFRATTASGKVCKSRLVFISRFCLLVIVIIRGWIIKGP